MEKTTIHLKAEKTKLSNVSIDREGNLVYIRPPFRQIARRMCKDFPIMCWYMLIGMFLLFTRSLWAVLHSAITVTSKFDLLIYIYLMLISSLVIAGLLGGSYYFAKKKLNSN